MCPDEVQVYSTRRKRRSKAGVEYTEPSQPVEATGQARYLSPYATRSAPEIRALRRVLNIEYPTAGVDVRPARRDFVQLNAGGTGWGSAVYMRPRYRGRGANRELHSVWALPVGILAVILVGYFVERIMVGMSNWWPGSKIGLALDDFGSWFSKNVLPQASSINVLTTTLSSWSGSLASGIQGTLTNIGGQWGWGTTTPPGGGGTGGGGGGTGGGGGNGPPPPPPPPPNYCTWTFSPQPTLPPWGWKWHSGMVAGVGPGGCTQPPNTQSGDGWGPGYWYWQMPGGPGGWIPPTL